MAAALRELSEETGYVATRIEPLGRMIPTGGYNSEVILLYLATGLIAHAPHPDEGEIVVPELMPFGKALELVLDGTIEDAKTAYGIMKYELLHRLTGRDNSLVPAGCEPCVEPEAKEEP
jgi:ADP-ribose pyrophosphatase